MCARSAWLRTREVALLRSKDDHPRGYEKQVSAARRSQPFPCSFNFRFLNCFSSLSCHISSLGIDRAHFLKDSHITVGQRLGSGSLGSTSDNGRSNHVLR